ncbi:WAS/WASL-interacting protein family member 3-like [Macaca thibetana thibetana]|uniref:WAS/WASL-interacting protein family member 3-like n=1 Tax=Macaca thibetana thibetana TaxID=257877 RepID=UPI0021BC5840|nr:WAS/WASL-interacting protein family member 3-like [Macaca thibetana thibetana]
MEPVRQDSEGHAQVRGASRWRPPLRPSAQLHTACGDTGTRGGGGRHLTYPATGSVRETAGSGRSKGRPTGPQSVSSGPPRPNGAPPARTVRKSQVRKSPPPTPPPPRPLPGRESLCGCVLMTSCRSGFSSAHSSTAFCLNSWCY